MVKTTSESVVWHYSQHGLASRELSVSARQGGVAEFFGMIMKRSLNCLYALTLAASLTMVSTQVQADVFVAETSTGTGKTLNLQLPIQSGAHNYFSGFLNLSIGTGLQGNSILNGMSFEAFCIDPAQFSSSSPFSYGVASLSTLGSTIASDVSKLYSQSYSSTFSNANNSAAFQLALWELAKDDGNLSTGQVKSTASTSTAVVAAATTMISNAKTAAAGATQYSFNLYTNAGHQDYLVASVTPVPEPETYAMLLCGLGLIGFTARRRWSLR